MVIMNFKGDDIVSELDGRGSYNFSPKKLALDLKNRVTPFAKPFIDSLQF